MDIRLYNTLTRSIDLLQPIEPGRLRMYTCGLTVYDYGHIGNYRTFVSVDVLQRFLRSEGLDVTAVLNITDVDDKMIERSREAGHSLQEHARIYTDAFLQDLKVLDIQMPTHLLRATDFIPDMVSWIQRLIDTGHAYESDGSVYFRVSSFPQYGRLSGKDLGGLHSGARVDSDKYDKEEARDFVLWKAHKEGEPSWDSPWGPGRPGWHIECSVMSMKLLGESFDLHAGGTDLMFPHHENEIAQSEAVTGKLFVRTWFHCEFLLVNGEKMSKSLGNFYTLRDLVGMGHKPSSIRFLLASVPYRRQLNFTFEGLTQAAASVERLRAFRDRLRTAELQPGESPELLSAAQKATHDMRASLANNLNSAEALAAIFELVRLGNIALDQHQVKQADRDAFLDVLRRFDQVFAVLEDADREKMGLLGAAAASGPSDAEIEDLLRQRTEARQQRDFARADAIRGQLDAAGVVVEDVKGGGLRWRRK